VRGMRGRFRHWAVSAVVSAALLFATGCGSDESIIGDGSVEMIWELPPTVEITLWHTYSDVEAWTFEHEVLPAFAKDHPDIRVVSVRKPYEYIKGALISESTSSSGPDVVRLDMAWLPEFAKLGLVDPVDSYPEFADIVRTIYPTALETNKYEGHYYGVPLNMNTKAAIYSRKLLDQAGVARPPDTMDELIDLSERMNQPLGIGGINAWSIMPYFFGLGGELTNEDYTQAIGYLDSEASIRAVEKLKWLLDRELISDDSLTGVLNRWQAVQDDKLLMIDEGPWYYTILSQMNGGGGSLAEERTVAAPFPHNPGTRAAIIGGENLVIMSGSQRKQAAWTLMQWLLDVPAQQIMFKTGLLPANSEASASLEDLGPTIRPFVESLDESFLRPPVTNWAKIDKDFGESLERIMRGRTPAVQGMQQLAVRVQALLKP